MSSNINKSISCIGIAFGVVLLSFVFYYLIPQITMYRWFQSTSNDEWVEPKEVGNLIRLLFAFVAGSVTYFYIKNFKNLINNSYLTIIGWPTVFILLSYIYDYVRYSHNKERLVSGNCQTYNKVTKQMQICPCELPGAIKNNNGFYIHPDTKTQIVPLNADVPLVEIDCDNPKFFEGNIPIIFFEKLGTCNFLLYNQRNEFSPVTGSILAPVNANIVKEILQCKCGVLEKQNDLEKSDTEYVVKKETKQLEIDRERYNTDCGNLDAPEEIGNSIQFDCTFFNNEPKSFSSGLVISYNAGYYLVYTLHDGYSDKFRGLELGENKCEHNTNSMYKICLTNLKSCLVLK